MECSVRLEGRRRLGLVTVRVVAGRNLPAADRNGFSDPFVEVPAAGAARVRTAARVRVAARVGTASPHRVPLCLWRRGRLAGLGPGAWLGCGRGAACPRLSLACGAHIVMTRRSAICRAAMCADRRAARASDSPAASRQATHASLSLRVSSRVPSRGGGRVSWVRVGAGRGRTSVKMRTLQPAWDESLAFQVKHGLGFSSHVRHLSSRTCGTRPWRSRCALLGRSPRRTVASQPAARRPIPPAGPVPLAGTGPVCRWRVAESTARLCRPARQDGRALVSRPSRQPVHGRPVGRRRGPGQLRPRGAAASLRCAAQPACRHLGPAGVFYLRPRRSCGKARLRLRRQKTVNGRSLP